MIPIEIRPTTDCVEGDVRGFAERWARFALDRLRNLRRVVVSIEDVNGPKGGPDKLCRILADLRFVSIVVEEIQPTWQSAMARAFRRVARNAARELHRVNRSHARSAHHSALRSVRMPRDTLPVAR